uniref:Uncharacterized protein n=1 Tax=Arundo donax TaxID=35708 RepID=A0A0A9AX33_ARUDO
MKIIKDGDWATIL